jgi:hypothetical protein
VLGGLVACSGDSTGTGSSNPVSIWELQTVRGQSLPVTVSVSGGVKVEVTKETLTMYSDTKFILKETARITSGGTVTSDSGQSTGHWSQANTSLAFTSDDDGSVTTGTIVGNVLTLDVGSYGLFVYRR